MFFKNIFVFAFTRPFNTTAIELDTLLQAHSFTPLGSTEMRHFGWVESLGKNSNLLVNESNGNVLICARSEEKILPAAVIKDAVNERIEVLESEQGRGASKKEREQFKEDVIFELLPRAFNRITDTHAYINVESNIIVINTSSRGKAENLLALLRKTLGTLPVTSPSPNNAPDELMTNWVIDANRCDGVLGEKFTVGMEAHFNSLGDQSASAIVKNQDLSCDEVKAHLDADQYVTKIALEYDETMSFMLNDDLSIKRIKFFDVIVEQNDDIDHDDLNAKIMADFTLMAGELNRMITDLFAEFGDDAKNYLDESCQ